MEFEVDEFLFWELPVELFVGAHAFGEGEEGECDGDGDVEGFGESVHGYFDVGVGHFDGLGRESCEFGAEDEGCFLCDVEFGDDFVALVWEGGYDAVSVVF